MAISYQSVFGGTGQKPHPLGVYFSQSLTLVRGCHVAGLDPGLLVGLILGTHKYTTIYVNKIHQISNVKKLLLSFEMGSPVQRGGVGAKKGPRRPRCHSRLAWPLPAHS